MVSAIKKKLSGFFDEIAVDLGLMTEEQSVENLTMQARFLMLWEKDIKPTERFLDADPLFEKVKDHWQEYEQQFSFSQTDFMYAYAKASSGKGFEKEQAPAIGQIAKALGNITSEVKNAILTAQAAVRTEQALHDIANPRAEAKSAEDIEHQHGRIDYEGKFDPTELVSAQINNRTADILHREVKEGMVAEKTSDQRMDYISRQTIESYKDASKMFKDLDIPAAKLIAQELERAAMGMGRQR